ncbi:hypothetical protein [Streptomyces maremycinicus]|uniref:hypothetical protein n=1 Tax=Streptomyces maremycinicus TaxID=1679753 RepID=UPI0013316CA4|nr:hypothetical protein [Streptomyces sp. NBRC 110468]
MGDFEPGVAVPNAVQGANADTGNKKWVNYAFESAVSYALYLIMTAFQPVTK